MRALLSVYDKTGLIELARGLDKLGVELLASGGTSGALKEAGLSYREVAEVTGAPEMLDGRVKTLHPRIAGGILADRSKPSHREDLERLEIDTIDLVVCNLYPFSSNPSIELIDVGGPTMVRATAKNHAHVGVIVDPSDYPVILKELEKGKGLSDATRQHLAAKAFAHTASYDTAIRDWFFQQEGGEQAREEALAPSIILQLERVETLRYGENPHQHGARYRLAGSADFWDTAVQHSGLAASYLNRFDAEAAWRLVVELDEIAAGRAVAVIVKHANPCGVAFAADPAEAYARAFAADSLSAFGGIVALGAPVDTSLATAIVANPRADVLIAPGFSPEALELFVTKRKNIRVIEAASPAARLRSYREIAGGFLVQDPDRFLATRDSWQVVTDREPTATQWDDLELAWRVCARTTSNAIVLAHDGQVVGVGAGQQSRVDAALIAARKANGRAKTGVAASDAFFPFRDGLDAIADAGVGAVIQPGGSVRDDDIVAAANERGIAMVLTGERHFRH